MGSAPKAPDPADTARQQRQENMWSSQYNTIGSNANQYTPYGSVTSAPGAKIPIYNEKGQITGYGTQWNQTTKLSPKEQAIFDQEQMSRLGLGKFANQQIGNLSTTLSKPFSSAGLPDWQFYGAGPNLRYEKSPTDRAAIEDAIMASHTRGQAPIRTAEDVQAAARGMGAPGSKYGYSTAQARGDVDAEAARNAYLASGDESRQATEAVNQTLQQIWNNKNLRVDQSNATRQGMFGERQQERNQIVNEIAALLGGGQVTVPQGQAFVGSQVNPFDWQSAVQNKYAQDMNSYQNRMTGLFGIGSAAMGMLPFA